MFKRWIGAIGVATICLLAGNATADTPTAGTTQPTTDGNKQLAVEWANKAKERFDKSDYQGAIDAINEAQKHLTPPTFARLSAQAHEKLGKLLEAQRIYQAIVALPLDASAPAAWQTAKTEAEKELKGLGPKIPTLRVTLLGVLLAGLEVTLDGAPFSLAQVGKAVQMNPGAHVLVVQSGGRSERREVVLKEGDQQDVSVQFLVDAPLPTAVPAVAEPTSISGAGKPPASAMTAGGLRNAISNQSAAPPASADTSARRGPPTATYLTYGLGAAGLIATAVLGARTLLLQGELSTEITKFQKKEVYRPFEPIAAEGRAFAMATDVALILSVTSIATGTVVWILGRNSTDATQPKHVGVSLGPGGLSIQGNF